MLAIALRRLGHETVFVVESADKLNRPEFKYSEILWPHPEWIIDASPFGLRDIVSATPANKAILERLASCDFLVLNGLGPALAASLNVPAAAILTGSDLEFFASWKTPWFVFSEYVRERRFVRGVAAAIFYAWVVLRQRRGIRRSFSVNYFAEGLVAEGDRLLRQIGVGASRRTAFMMTDTDAVPFRPPPKNAILRVFNVARLNWKLPVPAGMCELDFKGTDVLLRGVALFAGLHGRQLQLVLVRKGGHVPETEALVGELGLHDVVLWRDELSQAEVLEEYALADIVVEQLASSVVGMGGLDAMATGRPLIANGRPEIFEPLIGVPSPICQARTPEEVLAQLERLADPDTRVQVGKASRAYVEKHFSSLAAARTLIERASLGKVPTKIAAKQAG